MYTRCGWDFFFFFAITFHNYDCVKILLFTQSLTFLYVYIHLKDVDIGYMKVNCWIFFHRPELA